MAHKHVVLRAGPGGACLLVARESALAQVALDAPLQGRKAQVALVYDRLVRRTWAVRAAAGAAGFKAAASRHASMRYYRARVGAQVNEAAMSLDSGLLRAAEAEYDRALKAALLNLLSRAAPPPPRRWLRQSARGQGKAPRRRAGRVRAPQVRRALRVPPSSLRRMTASRKPTGGFPALLAAGRTTSVPGIRGRCIHLRRSRAPDARRRHAHRVARGDVWGARQ